MSNRLASELGFWSWLGRRAREWLKSPSAAAFVCLAAGLTLAACDILLFVAGEPRPILFGEGAWAVTAYGIAALRWWRSDSS